MHRLQIELVIGLDRDEPHVLALYGLGDSLRVHEIVLVGLHKRLHELRRDQPHLVTLLLQGSTEKVGSEQASRPISEVCMFAVNASNCFCVNFFFTSTLPDAPSATR